MTTSVEGGAPGTAPLESRLEAVFESVADAVTVMDRNGRIRFANPAAAQLLGRSSANELIGLSGGELLAEYELLDTDGSPLPPDALPSRRALAGEASPERVVRFRRRGSLDDRWSLVRARLLSGRTADEDLVVSAFQDITSLKRSESRLRFLAEASAILAESVDYARTLQRVADTAVPELADWCVVDVLEWTHGISRVAIAHRDPAGLELANQVWSRWPPDPRRYGAVHEMLRRRSPVLIPDVTDDLLSDAAQDAEHLAVLRRLNMRSVLVVPLEARGEVLGALTLVQSESGRRLDEADVDLAVELGRRAGAAIDVARLVWEAQENARLREEFIAVASHDMRTPLAAVRGYAQLAQRHLEREEAPDGAALGRWLRDIDHAVDRLARLVSELLDASLVRADQQVPLQLGPTTLSQLVREVVERYEQLSDRHGFVVETPEPEPVGMWDAARLARVLDNLVGNAVKFSPDGGEVRLRTGQEGDRAFISVTDQGIGIPATDREMIFNPMYRGGNVDGVAGTGLGLAGSRRLVEMMGGSIQVASEVGRGSTFTVWLPVQPPSSGEASGI
ncbi:MAG TPA: ATP-binding protein [Candidatus Limnocylindria bacterium]|nr:ATP-binding protein [Candidatus Limnocylindria bacterium]